MKKYIPLMVLCATANAEQDVIFENGFEDICATIEKPAGYLEVRADYETFNDGQPFGGLHSSFELDFRTDRIMALRGFSFTEPNSRRRMVFEDAPTNYNQMGWVTISVSSCPGDFTANAECLMLAHNSSTLSYSTQPETLPHYCVIDHTKEYWINYILTPDPFLVPAECRNPAHNKCAVFYAEAPLHND